MGSIGAEGGGPQRGYVFSVTFDGIEIVFWVVTSGKHQNREDTRFGTKGLGELTPEKRFLTRLA